MHNITNAFYDIKIFDTSYEGYGVGKLPDGKVIFIPETVTGDIVKAKIHINKKHHSYGRLISVLNKSPYRTTPECPYSEKCGGCQFMHIAYDHQIKIKANILKNALKNIQEVKINKIYTSKPFKYRLRTKLKIQNGMKGYFQKFTNKFINIKKCLILKDSLNSMSDEFALTINNKNIIDLYLIENQRNEFCMYSDLMRAGKEYILIDTAFGLVPATANGFFQSNLFLLNDFQKSIIEYLNNNDNVLELFCGTGLFTLAIANKSNIITAVDYDKNSISLAKKYHKNIDFLACDVENFIKNKINFNVLVVDPPRNGLSKQIKKFILEKLPKKIIYISCNPMTLARDIKELKKEYKILDIKLFDMFPQTYHIESIVYLGKK
jgi:23S rRNA (uracil1939-C5)-methyltransferase